MKQKIKEIGNKILDLMYPKNIKCMFCGAELRNDNKNCTCADCMEMLPFIQNPCFKCGSPMNSNQQGVCLKCKSRKFDFNRARSVFEYVEPPLSVVHRLKYHNAKFLVDYMVDYMFLAYPALEIVPDIVTNVPMFEKKEKERGYNQSRLLAEKFALKIDVDFKELCAKSVDTKSQTELNTKERIDNVKDSFVVKPEMKKLVKDKTILIVDDVITTGATTSEIGKMLFAHGAQAVYVLSFAHTKLEQILVD